MARSHALILSLPILVLACKPAESGDGGDETSTETADELGDSTSESSSTSNPEESESDSSSNESESSDTESSESESSDTESSDTESSDTTEEDTTEEDTTEEDTTEEDTTEEDTTEEDTTEEDTTETDTGMNECQGDDMWEENDLASQASMVAWGGVTAWNADVVVSAFLCSEDGDWYHFSIDDLNFEYYALHLDLLVEGTSWCGMGCDDDWLPNAPENSVGVVVYDAETMEMISSQVRQNGRINMGGSGEKYSRDLIVQVYGPTPEATFNYQLFVEIRGYDGEDECEC